jgi:hypothetical protein
MEIYESCRERPPRLARRRSGRKRSESALLGRAAVRHIFRPAHCVFESVSLLLPVGYGGAFGKQVHGSSSALIGVTVPKWEFCTLTIYL